MAESDLNLPTIVPLLQSKSTPAQKTDAAPPQQSSSSSSKANSQSDAFISEHPHLVPSSLKVETALLTKELAKFRACDQNTCFYCREWAQWIFKKMFGKEKGSSVADKKGGRAGSGGMSSTNSEGSGSEPKKKHKEYAMVVCERFYQQSTADNAAIGAHGRTPGSTGAGSVAAAAIAASKAGTGTTPAPPASGSNHDGFVSEIVETVREWIQQPSALYTSPEVFSLMDFEALYALCPLQNQEQNQQQDDVTPILATITIEKAHMILGHQGYPLLKRVTKAQLQNQIMNPTCQHTKGHSKTPADLELEKELFNEELKRMRMRDQEGLRKQIGPVWKHVEEALERMEGAERVRSGILSPSRAKEFAQTYKDRLLSFQDIWSKVESSVKKPSLKKKGSTSESIDLVAEADQGFQTFIDNLQFIHKQLITDVLDSSERSLREFIKELAAAQTKILKLALARIQEGKVGTARIDKILEESPEKCRKALKMVEQLIPIFDTKMAQFRVLVLNKLKEVDEEVEAVAAGYFQDSQKTVQGRLEKAANKEFRRRIKKLEFLSVETRKWFFQSRLTLFSSLDFATVCLNTLGILMEEAEVLEAVQLGLHDDHFRSRVVKSQEGRMKLALQFREGVKIGRKVLAVMISRLMMREGARAMGEMAAIQKEKKFLKSIGQDVNDSKLNVKGFLVPNKDVTPTASAQVSDEEEGDGPPSTGAMSKNKKKKEKKKKKAAEAAAATASATAGETAAREVKVTTEDIPFEGHASSQRVPGLIHVDRIEPLTALSSKEARELKKQAKKEAKRQAKEAAEAEETAAAQAAAKKAEEAQRLREMREAQEAIERQEAKELREKQKQLELERERKAAEEAREAEAARAKKAAEEEEARQKAIEAQEIKEAMERQRERERKQLEETINATKDIKTTKKIKETKETKEIKKLKETKGAKQTKGIPETNKDEGAMEPVYAASTTTHGNFTSVVTPKSMTSSKSNEEIDKEIKVPTWAPSAATLANRTAPTSEKIEGAQLAIRGQNAQEKERISIGDGWSQQTNGASQQKGWGKPDQPEQKGWGEVDQSEQGGCGKVEQPQKGWGEADQPQQKVWGEANQPEQIGWEKVDQPEQTGWEKSDRPEQIGWEKTDQPEQTGWGEVDQPEQIGWGKVDQPQQKVWGDANQPEQIGWKADQPQQTGWGEVDRPEQTGWGSIDPPQQKAWGDASQPEQIGWEKTTQPQQTGWGDANGSQQKEWENADQPQQKGWGKVGQFQQKAWGGTDQLEQTRQRDLEKTDRSQEEELEDTDQPQQKTWEKRDQFQQRGWGKKDQPQQRGWGKKDQSQERGWGRTDQPQERGWRADLPQQRGWGKADQPQERGWRSDQPQERSWRSDQSQQKGWGKTDQPQERGWGKAEQPQRKVWGKADQFQQREQWTVAQEPEEENTADGAEELSKLPAQALVSLVLTLQAENKSLLTTLVSMQQQVSSLTERYSTLATLAREHEQQTIQAMESQKKREMEEAQRYVWKVEERCRQLEKHILASHQHHLQLQQLQQLQLKQLQQPLASGSTGTSPLGNLSMPPPGFSNILGVNRQSQPSSPLLAQQTLASGSGSSSGSGDSSGDMDSPSSSAITTTSTIPISMTASSTSMAIYPNMESLVSDPMVSLMLSQQGLMNSSLLSTAPLPVASGGGVSMPSTNAPPGYEAAPKKTHWRQRGEVRCGNCAQLGHASSECQAGCRYCDETGHLSQDCPQMTTPDA
ncbi:hypothetical protein BX616_009581 [Lobosporangium transversale]|uniref:CCHC-type domain-containing protein n=1 Tax=Lobosporangium transversale TaxID=64571 RepID=A0A1Y2GXJ6_9FUNG|nr:hypothetical protein BCR41DRAFT_419419 [Lobosporangium transversale]KAF9918291.1 hypothetical protein BX616_009581 [Lobosporangium transversale]ORZ26997.1 hypothetical protein BCR41DRAFT_419419 [Lobosporangium transversale]|eukprot:XP_021884744.1 hypothetical protein BCR41DRAFT_419419 [Lobosporangium transversale]